jgi:carbon-monoxide dehydrogenase medium subunit
MRDFDYLEPTQAHGVCDLLAMHGDEARLIAGGTALLLALRQRLVMPQTLISLGRVAGLSDITLEGEVLSIGACATHSQIAASPLVQQHAPTLAFLEGQLANEQVRNQGTLGGNLAYADPTTDPPGCLLALNAHVVLQGQQGHRQMGMDAFLTDYFETALQQDEILTRVLIPISSTPGRNTYLRHLRTPADHRPMANVSVFTQGEGTDNPQIRVVLAAATPMPWSVPFADELLRSPLRAQDVDDFAGQATQEMQALSDARCGSDYRREVMRVLLTRSLTRHFSEQQGVQA